MAWNEERLVLHHVGGRSGSRAFPVLPHFEHDLVNVLYDADPDCLAQVKARNRALASELHVLPCCVGDGRRPGTFNLNYDPFTSSLLPFNERYASFYAFHEDHDYPLGEAFRTVERRPIELVSLDELLASPGQGVPPPDFLSLDTQGSEFDILRGAERTLRENILALVLEVEFHPIYRGQKLFGDLAAHLSERGFDFVKFLWIGECSPFRAPPGLRGEGFQTWGEALFFKRLDCLSGDAAGSVLRLHKLAFMALVHNQFEYALQCLRVAESSAPIAEVSRQLDRRSYAALLAAVRAAAARVAPTFPPTFGEKYTFVQSKGRFDAAPEEPPVPLPQAPAVPISQQNPPRTSRAVRRFNPVSWVVQAVRRALGNLGGGSQLAGQRESPPAQTSDSEVEAILRAYGLDEQAAVLQTTRLRQTPAGHQAPAVFAPPDAPAAPPRTFPISWSPGGPKGGYVCKPFQFELLSPAASTYQGEPPLAQLCLPSHGRLEVHPPHPCHDTATAIAVDLMGWPGGGVAVTGMQCEAAILSTEPSNPVVCRLELRDGERGTGRLLGHAEVTITSRDGWVSLQALVPAGTAIRSLVLSTRMAEGSAHHYFAHATFREVEVLSERSAARDGRVSGKNDEWALAG